jgi:2-polyprenyl-6-methoxyphenol hydroxylase-like FAD-dependent oxidoreductase
MAPHNMIQAQVSGSAGRPSQEANNVMRVVIHGAGPAGLLLAHYLLGKGEGRFKVWIYEEREDPRETLKKPPSTRRYIDLHAATSTLDSFF